MMIHLSMCVSSFSVWLEDCAYYLIGSNECCGEGNMKHVCLSYWNCLLLSVVCVLFDDDHVINVMKHVNWWTTQVLTGYTVLDVGGSC